MPGFCTGSTKLEETFKFGPFKKRDFPCPQGWSTKKQTGILDFAQFLFGFRTSFFSFLLFTTCHPPSSVLIDFSWECAQLPAAAKELPLRRCPNHHFHLFLAPSMHSLHRVQVPCLDLGTLRFRTFNLGGESPGKDQRRRRSLSSRSCCILSLGPFPWRKIRVVLRHGLGASSEGSSIPGPSLLAELITEPSTTL